MAELKSVAKDTAIYGLSSIIGKFLNYLLVPLYTAKMTVESGGYGIVTNIYAYVALLMVILTSGRETTRFRFANNEGKNRKPSMARHSPWWAACLCCLPCSYWLSSIR